MDAGEKRLQKIRLAPLARVQEAEIMDNLDLPEAEHVTALGGLRNMNKVSGSASILWRAIYPLLLNADRPLRVLDIATGGGDIPLALARRARRKGLPLNIEGCDLNPTSVRAARNAAETTGIPMRFFQLDAIRDELPWEYDVIVTSLFTHHLESGQVKTLMRKMSGAANRMILINDLVRSRTNLFMVALGTRLLSESTIIHHDGCASVRASYTTEEMRALALEAGLTGFQLTTKFPCRMLLRWLKPLVK